MSAMIDGGSTTGEGNRESTGVEPLCDVEGNEGIAGDCAEVEEIVILSDDEVEGEMMIDNEGNEDQQPCDGDIAGDASGSSKIVILSDDEVEGEIMIDNEGNEDQVPGDGEIAGEASGSSKDKRFNRGTKTKRSLLERMELGKLCIKHKEKYDATVQKGKQQVNFCPKRKKYVNRLPKAGYLAGALREYYPDLVSVKHNDPVFVRALKMAKRSYDLALQSHSVDLPPLKKQIRAPGAGRKVTVPEVRESMYQWFIDVRGALKGRLPMKLFKAQCKIFYEEWLLQQKDEEKKNKKIQFSKNWIRWWMKEYGVSLRKPNKRFKIKQDDRVERIKEYIMNVWRIRKFFQDTYGVDPPIINGDQMPLHRNESSGEKSMSFIGQDAYVKENYMLSRERITAYTQICSDDNIKFKPEFVFKGKGSRLNSKMNPPEGVKFYWAPKGSYRLEQMLKTISNLPDRYNIFTAKNYCIYVLDDYSVHCMPEIKESLLKRGYIYVGIGGGITGDIQINDTDAHAPLKKKYREEEMELMLQQLRHDKSKIPSPSREEMMSMLCKSWESLDIDFSERYKALWITNALDGSEDHLVSDRIFRLVGEDLQKFRKRLMKSPNPANLKALLKTITPPKGVKRSSKDEAPVDEGSELIDCDGEEEESIEQLENEELEDDDDAEGVDLPSNTEQDKENADPRPLNKSLWESCKTNYPHLEGDAKFLDQFELFFEKYRPGTTTAFEPYLRKFQRVYDTSRKALKKKMRPGPVEQRVTQPDESIEEEFWEDVNRDLREEIDREVEQQVEKEMEQDEDVEQRVTQPNESIEEEFGDDVNRDLREEIDREVEQQVEREMEQDEEISDNEED